MPGVHYAIIGNGVAGTEAALALRRREADARITVISAEHDHFFSRPALMYVFCGQLDLAATEPYDRGLYERLRFELIRQRVASLETASRRLSATALPGPKPRSRCGVARPTPASP